MAGNSNWDMDDLDGGLSTDLFNLSGLGNDLSAEPQAYKMRCVDSICIYRLKGFVYKVVLLFCSRKTQTQ